MAENGERYPTKRQSFSQEKDCFFVRYLSLFQLLVVRYGFSTEILNLVWLGVARVIKKISAFYMRRKNFIKTVIIVKSEGMASLS